MLKNLFLIAIRNLFRNKFFSFLNLAGLAVGMAVCLLILQYVYREYTFDNFHRRADNIYRVNFQRWQSGQLIENSASTFSGAGPALKREYPAVEAQTTFYAYDCILSASDAGPGVRSFKQANVFFVDSDFLKLFSFPLLKGFASSLSKPNNIILTKTTAKKYFGDADPIGKSIRVLNHNAGTDILATVQGICQDVPQNSHLQFDCLVSTASDAGNWTFPDAYSYILLSPGTDPRMIVAELPAFTRRHLSISSTSASADKRLTMIPMKSIHLDNSFSGEQSPGGNGRMVNALIVISVIILLIAYINYVNLSTIKAIERAKEVGLRKVFGSLRSSLIRQFTFESLLINFIGAILAVGIALFSRTLFYRLLGQELPLAFWGNPWLWIGLTMATVLGALVSGFYPAYLLSSYQPVQVLKGKMPVSRSAVGIRKALAVFQFSVSIILIICTYVVYQQVNYMRHGNLGVNIAQTLVVDAPSMDLETNGSRTGFYSRLASFENEVLNDRGVTAVTQSSNVPGMEPVWVRPYSRATEEHSSERKLYPTYTLGPEFIDQFGLQIAAGKKFKADRPNILADSGSRSYKEPVMINEAAVESFGFANDSAAIGQILTDKNGIGKTFEFEIVGVLRNFHQMSLKEAFKPIVFRLEDGSSIAYFAIKLNTKDLAETVAQIQNTYKSFFSASPFDYFFLDDFFDRQYIQDEKFGRLFAAFSALAIFIGCLGLLGLSMLTNMQRAKEVGIRKVLGASNLKLLALLLSDFAKLILVSSVIAWPLAFLGATLWLQSYASRISLNPILFVLPSALVLFIAFLTIGWHTLKAALVPPAVTLRNE